MEKEKNIAYFKKPQKKLLISMPHNGTAIPPEISEKMTDAGRAVADTDWYMRELYSFAEEMGAGIICPYYNRYVIDLNRPPDNENLYPGEDTPGLCPVKSFANHPLYLDGMEPTAEEIQQRLEKWWLPYHELLYTTLSEMQIEFGNVVLLEAHSIKSEVPRLFEGTLPDLNLGTAEGTSVSEYMQLKLEKFFGGWEEEFSIAINERFKGGYITRKYGKEKGIEAVQIEICQKLYKDETVPCSGLKEDHSKLKNFLTEFIEVLINA